MSVDWRYQVWQAGVTITDNAFLYSLWYFIFSVLGNLNMFFFAAHLLDVAVGFKTLRTILQSVTHNGKQLVLTVLLLTIIVYIYTVIAFNFFRKFYVQEEDEEVDKKCHDMLTVRARIKSVNLELKQFVAVFCFPPVQRSASRWRYRG